MRKLFILSRYIRYLLLAKSRFKVHSPFVYKFVEEVLRDQTNFNEYNQVEEIAGMLRNSRKLIEVTDFGEGSGKKKFKVRFRRVAEIARTASLPANTGSLLFRMARYFKPENILELGTSLGISTMYLSLAVPGAKVVTIEGCANTAQIAQKNFNNLNLGNIALQISSFDCALPGIIKEIEKLDFVFIDGNHRKEPTLSYFKACLQKTHENSIIVFDDIHWSRGMEEAWEEIKAHPQVKVSIDLFRLGLIFFRNELSKEDFVLR